MYIYHRQEEIAISAHMQLKAAVVKKIAVTAMLFILAIVSVTTVYLMRRNIDVVIDGKHMRYATFKSTVREALESKDIALAPKDRIEPSLDSKLKDHEVINIKRAVNVKVFADGKEQDILSSEENVGTLLKAEGITPDPDDRVEPDSSSKITPGLEIKIVRVETKVLKESLAVDFKTVTKYNSSLANTKQKVLQEGKAGQKQITYSVVYEDGQEVSRKAVSETVIKKPIDKILVKGTYPLMPVSSRGDIMPYSKVINARATAYWAVNGVGHTYTASGRKAVRDPDGYSTVAVDRNVFPYGTKLFIEGYGFAIAADTGTSIIGNKIDVYFNTYKEACQWGAKYVKVYVLK
jgi:uncharacterized protein YabE (DUF348 family)